MVWMTISMSDLIVLAFAIFTPTYVCVDDSRSSLWLLHLNCSAILYADPDAMLTMDVVSPLTFN